MNAQRFDIAIVGAGPAGLEAARIAVAAGARVALIDDNPRPGGQIWRQGPAADISPLLRGWLESTAARVDLDVMTATKVAAAQGGKRLLLEREGVAAVIGYGTLILATGARERLLPFEGWTLPGVTGAGGLQALIKGGFPVRGERIVVAGSGPLLLAAADTARRYGADVRAVVEQAPMARIARFLGSLAATPAKLAQAVALARALGVSRYRTGSVVVKAEGDARVERVTRVTIRTRNGEETMEADRVACGYGLVPNTTLALALGCALDENGAIRVDDRQRTSLADVLAAGECTGVGGMELARAEGACAAHAALGAPIDARWHRERNRWRAFAARVERAFELGEAARAMPPADTTMCRCEDVTICEVAAHASWREAKLLTRCGMGPCQGRICGEAAALYFGWPRAAAREPFAPVRIDTLLAACDSLDDT
ncbi:FAD-dependent oxidoreductase [Caballeronia sp. Lep1P3]|uniref:FAD-dependent oxidoreductase n=1 Tax=Caballeronia sp. Lep1P3 TaxID=2878150 RepID=UPI001FD10663|nr:FAD-dependent oxidoreductase [Caballeronia sp. Lep1P3]